MPGPGFDGALVVDKPVGPTSHDVVLSLRRQLKVRVGHTGTLDPAASGVLVLMLGKATRLARFYQDSQKEYRAQIRLGISTDTQDSEGKILKRRPVPTLSAAAAEQFLDSFRGEIIQVPPMFSAVKVGGQRLYKAARKGLTLRRPERRAHVLSLKLEEQAPRRWTIHVVCSAGTYIRTLAHDLGEEIGCGACVESLRRLRAGPFTLHQAIQLEQSRSELIQALIPLNDLLGHLPSLDLTAEETRRISHGNPIPTTALAASQHCRLFYAGELIGIGTVEEGHIRPAMVLK